MSVLPARRAVAGLIVLAAFALLARSATAALDSKPPTKPGNLRATRRATAARRAGAVRPQSGRARRP
jgi:hypothetical protein